MEEIFDKLYPQYHGELAKVLVSDDPRVYGKGGLLDQFTYNDMPRIAISVDMLDTLSSGRWSGVAHACWKPVNPSPGALKKTCS